jgi:magnesium transporter
MPDQMTNEIDQKEKNFFLSEILNTPVLVRGKKVGSLDDFVIIETTIIPEVKSLFVRRPFGHPALLIPSDKILSISREKTEIDIEDIKSFEAEPAADAILLRDYILDKKVIDLEEHEVEIVYDIKLEQRYDKLYVTAVNTGKAARLRRMGLAPLARIMYRSEEEGEEVIPWTYIQPLPTGIGRFRGNIKLRVLKKNLAKIHPADLADILEELDHNQRLVVFSALEPEKASDTLEEIEPPVQRDLVSSLHKDKVVTLINEMTTGQAADILSVIPASEANEILESLDPENARKIRSILWKQEEEVFNYTTQKFLRYYADDTVKEVQSDYPKAAKGKDVVMYLYIIDDMETLLGVIDVKELLMADEQARLRKIMVENVTSLKPDSTLKEASDLFKRYDFRALPVVDDENHLIGVIPYRDVMNLTHHFID